MGRVRRTEALEVIARRVREVAEADLVLLLVHDEDTGVLTVEVAQFKDGPPDGLTGATVAVDQSHFGAALMSREHMVVDNLWAAAPWPVSLPERPAGTSF